MSRKLSLISLVSIVWLLIWVMVIPTSGEWTSSTNSSCVMKMLEDDCGGAVTTDNSMLCCMEIERETQVNNTVCMCNAFSNDTNFVDGFMKYCSSSILGVRLLCPDAVLLNSSTTVNSTTPANSNTSSTTSTSGKKGSSTITAVVVSIVVVVVLAIIVISIICIRKRKGRKNECVLPNQSQSPGDTPPESGASASVSKKLSENKSGFKSEESSEYDLETLKVATNNFSVNNKIGGGGFGFVYKGILPNGLEIAVKRLSPESGQGDKEFQAEVELLAKLKHRNLVQLLGFCLMNGEALLVYELAVNKSLDYFLFDSEAQRAKLKWSDRFEIIKGVARGMLYLHDDAPQKTIHRDLKAANVLLDAHMKPKIADFGLARKFGPDQTRAAQTYNVIGTRGYMAPEYYRGQITTQTDVYAFGVLVLEIISGRSVNGYSTDDAGELPEDLLKYVWRCWYDDKNSLELIMDPLMKDSFSSYEVKKCIQLGLLCVQEKSSERPKMSEILHNLNSGPQSAVLPTPRCPQDVFLGGPESNTTMSTGLSVAPSTGAIISSSANNNKFDFNNPR